MGRPQEISDAFAQRVLTGSPNGMNCTLEHWRKFRRPGSGASCQAFWLDTGYASNWKVHLGIVIGAMFIDCVTQMTLSLSLRNLTARKRNDSREITTDGVRMRDRCRMAFGKRAIAAINGNSSHCVSWS
jgi:hypothetical protein